LAEDDGKVIGVEDPLLMEEQLSNAIADSIAPAIIPDIEIFTIESKSLLCIRLTVFPHPDVQEITPHVEQRLYLILL
jgi:predicted HTH transcriptional regulator